jgi:L-lysine 6-transaminase
MVRSQKYLEIIEEDKLVDNARVVGEHLIGRLNELQTEFPKLVGNVRGKGLFSAFDLPTTAQRNELRKKASDKGLVILGSGAFAMRFRPPLTINKNQIDEGVNILKESLKEMKS